MFINYFHNVAHRKLLLSLLTAGCLLAAPQTLFAEIRCDTIFQNVSNREISKNFKFDKNYKVEVTQQSEVKNQCSLDTCHLHSWASKLERDYTNSTGDKIEISTQYLSAAHWFRKVIEKIDSNDFRDLGVHLGENIFYSRWAILDSGIIPKEAWTGSTTFDLKPNSDRITTYIQKILARSKNQLSMQNDPEIKEQIRNKAKKDIENIFASTIGKFPKTFTFRNKEYTPSTFQKVFFPEITKPITYISVNPNRHSQTNLISTGSTFTIMSSSIDVIEKTMKRLLDNNENIYITYDHNENYVDRNSGLMSIAAFKTSNSEKPLSRQLRNDASFISNDHAIQVVGYDYDPATNRITKWKIKNSWGKNSGDNGYFHMYSDYFRTFAISISFYRDSRFTPSVYNADTP